MGTARLAGRTLGQPARALAGDAGASAGFVVGTLGLLSWMEWGGERGWPAAALAVVGSALLGSVLSLNRRLVLDPGARTAELQLRWWSLTLDRRRLAPEALTLREVRSGETEPGPGLPILRISFGSTLIVDLARPAELLDPLREDLRRFGLGARDATPRRGGAEGGASARAEPPPPPSEDTRVE